MMKASDEMLHYEKHIQQKKMYHSVVISIEFCYNMSFLDMKGEVFKRA